MYYAKITIKHEALVLDHQGTSLNYKYLDPEDEAWQGWQLFSKTIIIQIMDAKYCLEFKLFNFSHNESTSHANRMTI